ncbi:testis-expressed protein 48 [Ovis aries]|uniref:testis-expressed protein 48 n=1 Tax=Ovis aries TaxID=9940 RepID=UPI0029527478|nr:testis-expressed protein 48 [Ovis aries]
MAAHQNLASKIFSLCCKCCEKPDVADDSKIPSQTQELQLSKHEYQHVPDGGWGRHMTHRLFQNLIPTGDSGDRNSPSRPKAGASLRVLLPFLLSDVNLQASKRGFHKRRLSRYSQDRWPYQPCLIGRP